MSSGSSSRCSVSVAQWKPGIARRVGLVLREMQQASYHATWPGATRGAATRRRAESSSRSRLRRTTSRRARRGHRAWSAPPCRRRRGRRERPTLRSTTTLRTTPCAGPPLPSCQRRRRRARARARRPASFLGGTPAKVQKGRSRCLLATRSTGRRRRAAAGAAAAARPLAQVGGRCHRRVQPGRAQGSGQLRAAREPEAPPTEEAAAAARRRRRRRRRPSRRRRRRRRSRSRSGTATRLSCPP